VSFLRLKKIWKDYVKYGVVHDEEGLNEIANKMLDNLAKLQAVTDLSGHSQITMKEISEECGIETLPEDSSDFYFNFLETKYGTPISDYGLNKLWDIAFQIAKAKDAKDKLLLIDQMLNVVHQRGDLAALFIEGGSSSLSNLSDLN